ncbi:MAG: hypothetical protein PHE67_00720 [Campylobacterales bacterium]|nr:hypothetical protein [Campylobacterales bacterium]
MLVKKVLFLFLLSSLPLLYADATTVAPSQSGGIIDIYTADGNGQQSTSKLYLTIDKTKKMLDSIFTSTLRNKSVFQCVDNTCPLDKTECVNSTCPVGTYNPTLKKCVTTPTTADCVSGAVWNSTTLRCETTLTTYETPSLTAMASCFSDQSYCTHWGFCGGFDLMSSGYVWWWGGKTLVLKKNSCSTGCDYSSLSMQYIDCNAHPEYCNINDDNGNFCGAGKIFYNGSCQNYTNVIPASYVISYSAGYGRASGYAICKSQSCIVQQGYTSEGIPFTYCQNGTSTSQISCTNGVPTLVNGVATCKKSTTTQTNPNCPANFTYVLADGLCESDPQCPTGMTWNPTSGFCEATPTCTSPATWNSTSKKCETGGTTTYAASISGYVGDIYLYSYYDGWTPTPEICTNCTTKNGYLYGTPVFTCYINQSNGKVGTYYYGYIVEAQFGFQGVVNGYDFSYGKLNYFGNGSYEESISANGDLACVFRNIHTSYTCDSGGTLSGTSCTNSTITQTNGLCSNGTLNQLAGVCQAAPGGMTCPSGTYQCNASTTDNKQYCSPYSCVDSICGAAKCETTQEATDGATDLTQCYAIACDINKPYNTLCKKKTCEGGQGIQMDSSGNCYQMVCPEGSTELSDGTCQILTCPIGTHEVNGSCINN